MKKHSQSYEEFLERNSESLREREYYLWKRREAKNQDEPDYVKGIRLMIYNRIIDMYDSVIYKEEDIDKEKVNNLESQIEGRVEWIIKQYNG